MKKTVLAILLTAVMGTFMLTGCGGSSTQTAETKTESTAEESVAESTAKETTADASDTVSVDSDGVANITSSLAGQWQDGNGNLYQFNEDGSYEGYDPNSGEQVAGGYSLVTDGTYVVLSVQSTTDSNDVVQYYVQVSSDNSQFVLTEVKSGTEVTLTPYQQ